MLSIVKAHDAAATSVCWRADGGLLTSAVDGSIGIWRYDADAEVSAADAAGKKDDGKKKDVHAVTRLKMLDAAHSSACVSVVCDTAGNVAASTSQSGELTIWDLTSYAKTTSVAPNPSNIWRAAFSPVAPQIATGGLSGAVHFHDAATGDSQGSAATTGDFTNALCYSADGRILAAGCMDGSLHLIDVEARAVRLRVDAHSLPIRCVSFSHDGHFLATGSDDRRINVYDVSAVTAADAAASAAGASAAGAAAGSGAAAAAPLVVSLHGHSHWVLGVAWAPDKHVLASSSGDRTVRLWDMKKRECVHTYEGHTDKVWGVAWHPSGTRIASVSEAGGLGLHGVASVI